MSKGRSSPAPFTTIGVSSLLVVFIILCLVTFACLSLSTAKSDYEFAKKMLLIRPHIIKPVTKRSRT
ncbi:MAG: hypothetical protein ACOX4R_03400 [Lentihominibacter sp.]|jgi:hypothetical protein